MDFGVAQNTAWFESQVVNASERWAGLWEVPLWVLQAFGLEWSMDVGEQQPATAGRRCESGS